MTEQPSKTMSQVVRYGIVGLASNLTGYILYLLLTAFVLPPKLSMTILYTSGAVIGFFGNRNFTFRHKGSSARAALAYSVVHFGGWALNFLLLYVFSDQFGYSHQIVQAAAIFVVAGYLFVAMRHFVFAENGTPEGAPK